VVPHPFGVSLFEHNVYFTDWTKMAVMKANKFTDSSPQVVYKTSQTPHGVAVIHQLKQPQGKFRSGPNVFSSECSLISLQFYPSCNRMIAASVFKDQNSSHMFSDCYNCFLVSPVPNPCSADRGGCEQICVLSHRSDNGGLGYRCKCRMGYDLHADGKRCLGKRKFPCLTVLICYQPQNIFRFKVFIAPRRWNSLPKRTCSKTSISCDMRILPGQFGYIFFRQL